MTRPSCGAQVTTQLERIQFWCHGIKETKGCLHQAMQSRRHPTTKACAQALCHHVHAHAAFARPACGAQVTTQLDCILSCCHGTCETKGCLHQAAQSRRHPTTKACLQGHRRRNHVVCRNRLRACEQLMTLPRAYEQLGKVRTPSQQLTRGCVHANRQANYPHVACSSQSIGLLRSADDMHMLRRLAPAAEHKSPHN